jgi:hypothetical protein
VGVWVGLSVLWCFALVTKRYLRLFGPGKAGFSFAQVTGTMHCFWLTSSLAVCGSLIRAFTDTVGCGEVWGFPEKRFVEAVE